jgi:S1-C subfamily serine protease
MTSKNWPSRPSAGRKAFPILFSALLWHSSLTIAGPLAATGSEKLGDPLLEYEKNTINVFKQNARAVVNITNVRLARDWYYGTVEVPKGTGSGFVWNSEGYIVTNFHVVQGGNGFFVSFQNDDKQYPADIVGLSPSKDIAVLKLQKNPAHLYPVTLGNSSELQVGQKTIAIGNPFGLDNTLTTGIVSALGRKITGVSGLKISDMIQTDASINPGNSGGPLIDSHGRLIGMNTMIYSSSGASSGIGFAVPVDTLSRIVPELMAHGKEIRPGLGIAILPSHFNRRFGINKGIVIESLANNSSAEQAGLRSLGQDINGRYYLGDVILEIDKKATNDYEDIYEILDKRKVGDSVELTILRNQEKKKVMVKLVPIDD